MSRSAYRAVIKGPGPFSLAIINVTPPTFVGK